MTTVGAHCAVAHVSKRYRSRWALRDITLDLKPGEVVGIAGPNGAGKSTLAKLLLGFALPDEGTVSINGALPRLFRDSVGVGYAPEEIRPPWECSVREFLMFRTHAEYDLGTSRVILSLGVDQLLDRPIRQLSKGQWRASLICFAFLATSSLFVLDEPDSGLDPDALDRLELTVRERASTGATVVILSHNLDALQRMSNRLIFIFDGLVKADLAPEALRHTDARAEYRRITRE